MRFRFSLGLMAVIAIAVGSLVGALIVRSNEDSAFDHRQDEEAQRSAHQTEALADLSLGQLASAGAFYQAEGHFNRHEFDVIADSVLETGALTATAFVQVVPGAGRDRYERSQGFPIVERDGLQFRPEEARRTYYPLTYVDSRSKVKPVFGYDVGGDPERARFLRRARDTGKPTATSAIRLLIGGTGVNVYRPVYRDGAPTSTVGERRAALIGFAAGAFRVPDLATAATAALPDDVDVQLIDHGQSVLGPSESLEDPSKARVAIADRSWLLVVRDPSRPGVALPVLMAVFGISLAALLAALVLIWSRNERMRELQKQASQDPLTGLKNRRRFEEDLRLELARSRRERTSGALLMLDIDEFKRVNDTLGHPTGDRVIEEIGGVLGSRMRETDTLARVGGDEFAVVMPRCGEDEAVSVGEGIAASVRQHKPVTDGLPPMTVSIGLAMFGEGTGATFEQVMADADSAMYAAKEEGRDGVRLAGSPASEAR